MTDGVQALPDATKIRVGVLPTQMHPADAAPVIGLAAAAIGIIAAAGNKDAEMVDKMLAAAVRSFNRMRPQARENLLAAADEMIRAVREGKDFMVLGGFQQPPG